MNGSKTLTLFLWRSVDERLTIRLDREQFDLTQNSLDLDVAYIYSDGSRDVV